MPVRARALLSKRAPLERVCRHFCRLLLGEREDEEQWPPQVRAALKGLRQAIRDLERIAIRKRDPWSQLLAGRNVAWERECHLAVRRRHGEEFDEEKLQKFHDETARLRTAEMRRVAEQQQWLRAAEAEDLPRTGRGGRPRKFPVKSIADGFQWTSGPNKIRFPLLRLQVEVYSHLLSVLGKKVLPAAQTLVIVYLDRLKTENPPLYRELTAKYKQLESARFTKIEAMTEVCRDDPRVKLRSLEALLSAARRAE